MNAKHSLYVAALAVGMVAGCSNEEKSPVTATTPGTVNVVTPPGQPANAPSNAKVGTGTLTISNDPQYTGKTTVVTKDGKEPEVGQTNGPAGK